MYFAYYTDFTRFISWNTDVECWILLHLTSTQSGIWGTLNTIAVRQLGIDFQYIQIKSFDNNPTSQLALGISGLRWIFDCRRSEDSQEIQIDVKAIVCVIKWNRPVLLAFLCISRVLSARVGTSNTNRLAKSFLANRAWHQSFIYHQRITNWFLIWWLNTKNLSMFFILFLCSQHFVRIRPVFIPLTQISRLASFKSKFLTQACAETGKSANTRETTAAAEMRAMWV